MADGQESPYSVPPFEVNIAAFGQTLRFESYEDLRIWAEKETEAWKFLLDSAKNFGPVADTAARTQFDFFDRLAKGAATATSAQNPPDITRARNGVRNSLSVLESGRRPIVNSPVGTKILSSPDDDPAQRFGLLIWQIGDLQHNIAGINIIAVMQMMIDARLDQQAGVGDVEAETKALADLRMEWRATFNELHQHTVQLAADMADERLDLATSAKQVLDQLSLDRVHHTQRMQDIEQSFRTKMTVRASTDYWGKRAVAGSKRANWALVRFFAVLVVGLLVWWDAFPWLIDSLNKESVGINTFHVVLFGLPTLLGLWVMRLFQNQYRTHQAISDDAEERVSMAESFIALEAEGRIPEEERQIVLNALFRPHKSGQEEGMPHPIMALLESILKVLTRRPN